ncbi:ATP synthase beta subunit, partial [Pisolithus croceorrhizus]
KRAKPTSASRTTSVQAVYVPADDLMDPSPATTFTHSDTTTAPSHSIAELGIYPAINPLDSKSHTLDPCIVGQEYYKAATTILKILPDYKSLQNIITILGMDEFLGEDKLTICTIMLVECTCKIQQFMSQPFQVAQVFTGYEGKLIQLKDTVQSFKDSSSGAHDNLLRLLPTW